MVPAPAAPASPPPAGAAALAQAQPGVGDGVGIVEKQRFRIDGFETEFGVGLPFVEFGFETYGRLSQARDNAILINHFFMGTSHAAGFYSRDDRTPGYWDAFIGPGRAVDTDRFFVIAADSLINANALSPKVITTGPASIDPRTGRRYGLTFPVISFGDMVVAQKTLVESFGITKLHAAMGASMGGCHAIELATSYPAFVDRIIPIFSGAEADAWLIAWVNLWTSQLKLDPRWNNGDYYDGEFPLDGLLAAIRILTMQGRHWNWVNSTFGREPADAARNPTLHMDALYKVEEYFDQMARFRAKSTDPNHLLYLARALQTYHAGPRNMHLKESLAGISARTLVIYSSEEDHLFTGPNIDKFIDLLMAAGVKLQVIQRYGTQGHIDCVLDIQPAAPAIKAFLEG